MTNPRVLRTHRIAYFIFFSTALAITPAAGYSMNPMLGKFSGMRSWKSIRDANLVRQGNDYSCGASAISTLLTYYFKRPTTELQVLSNLPAVNRPYSLTDMQAALSTFGYDAIAVRGNYSTLEALRIPAIVYLHPRRSRTTVGHFVVLRSVGPNNVVVADPAIGTRTYSKAEFLEKWMGTGKNKSEMGIFMLARLSNGSENHLQRWDTIPPDVRSEHFFWRGGRQQRFPFWIAF